MKKKSTIVIGLVFSLLASNMVVYSQQVDKSVLAVLDLKAENMKDSDVRIITDYVEEAVFKTDQYVLVERNKVQKLLSETKYTQVGVCELECAVKIGKQLSAKKVIIGTVGTLGEFFFINLKIIDVEKAQIIKMESLRRDCSLGELPDYLGEVVNRLLGLPGTSGSIANAPQRIEPVKKVEKPLTELPRKTLNPASDRLFESSAELEEQLARYTSRKRWGFFVGIPGIVATGLFAINLVVKANDSDSFEEMIPNIIVIVHGIALAILGKLLVSSGNRGIKRVEREMSKSQFSLNINPAKKQYGISYSISF